MNSLSRRRLCGSIKQTGELRKHYNDSKKEERSRESGTDIGFDTQTLKLYPTQELDAL